MRTFLRENNISNPQEKAPAQPVVNNEQRKPKPEKPQRKAENKQAKEKNEQRRNNNRQKDRNRRRQDNRTDKNANNPNITVRSFSGKILGRYEARDDVTRDFYGKILYRGNMAAALLVL